MGSSEQSSGMWNASHPTLVHALLGVAVANAFVPSSSSSPSAKDQTITALALLIVEGGNRIAGTDLSISTSYSSHERKIAYTGADEAVLHACLAQSPLLLSCFL